MSSNIAFAGLDVMWTQRSPKVAVFSAIYEESNQKRDKYRSVDHIQFDELQQTIEHNSAKPWSYAMAVKSKNERKILGFKVSSMPATGTRPKFHERNRARPDHRKAWLTDLFNDLSLFCPTLPFHPTNACFIRAVRQCFPKSDCECTGKKSSVAG